MIFTLRELIDAVMMTLFIGFIFSRYFRRKPLEDYDPLRHYKKSSLWEDIKWGALVAAPAVVLHELAHKFVAMAFGAQATLYAPSLFGIPYGMYIFVILLSYLQFPIVFFVGGYVAHTTLPPLPSALVALAGPLMNLILWLFSILVIKYGLIKRRYWEAITLAGKLNMFLFAFNMIPIPGFDGFAFITSLVKAVF
ncbi:M50 family metallopeptidase [Candidatus Woesearchaeota archaeon]|nr:M50 family metallopeptidase [Candidatus Woesearchaeota archaeon]